MQHPYIVNDLEYMCVVYTVAHKAKKIGDLFTAVLHDMLLH